MTLRIPGCTYRLQLNRNFNFRGATALCDYLDALGVTDVYASPILAARPGSAHGYDVIDHARLNPELGTESDLEALVGELRSSAGMGLMLDLVPNHMCIATSDNRWWNDVLENGRGSPYAPFFDIDWHPPKSELHEKVLLPVLGEQYGRVLENQEISHRLRGGRLLRPLRAAALSDRPAHDPAAARADGRRSEAQPSARSPRSPGDGEPRDRDPAPAEALGDRPGSRSASASAKRRSSSAGSMRWSRAAPRLAMPWSAASPP